MSRNLTLQLVIAALLALVFVATVIQIVQYNSIESTLIEVRQKVAYNETTLTQLKDTVDRGVAVGRPDAVVADAGELPAPDANEILGVDPVPLRAPGAKSGGELKISQGYDIKGFNRLVDKGAGMQELYTGLLGDQLARRHFKDASKWHGQLARSVRISDDKKTYHVKLRKGVLYHKPAVDFSSPRYKWLEGDHEVTSDDFLFAMQMTMNDKVEGAAPRRTYFKDFDRLEVIGPYEFKVHWKEAYPLSETMTLEMYPLPRWLYAYDEDGQPYPEAILGLKLNSHWYNNRAIGTGPFVFVEFKPGEHLKLQRNDRYYAGVAALSSIFIKVIKDRDQRLLQFRKGELDLMVLTPTQYRNQILDDPESPFKTGKYKHDFYTRLSYFFTAYNGDGMFFGDKRVRLAMTSAFNRKKIIEEVFVGLGTVVTGPFHLNTPWYDHSLEPHPFDLAKAAALLDEAGWKDTDGDGIRDKVVKGEKTKFEFKILIFNNLPEYKTLADIFKEDLIKIGVKMDIVPVDWPAMLKKMDDRDFDAFTGGWALDWESDPYQLWHSSQADIPKGSNQIGFRNKEADEIIMEARTTFDFEKRKTLLRRFHKILYDEQPTTFFYTPKAVIAWNPRLRNVTFQDVRPQTLYGLMWIDE